MSKELPLLQRLKALIDADIAINSIPSPNFSFSEWQAISRALAEQAQPVAECVDDICSEHSGRVEAFDHLPAGTKLYTTPPAPVVPQPVAAYKVRITGRWHEAEPTAAAFNLPDGEHLLYTTPPVVPQSLTNEQTTALSIVLNHFGDDPRIESLRSLVKQKCPCGDRPADQCPGEWESGCDLGANEKHAKVYEEKEPK